jgi:head-tail adaptor
VGIIAGDLVISARPHRVGLQEQGPPVPDGDGGYIAAWIDLNPPQVWAQIVPASARSIEHLTANAAVQAVATHVVTLPYHPQLTVTSKVVFGTREFQVHDIANLEERNTTHVLICSEILHGANGVGRRG